MMTESPLIYLGLFMLYFGIPVLIARFVVRGSWRQIFISYGLLYGSLLMLGLGSSASIEEKLGWPIILGMFVSIPGIPIIVAILKARRVR
jgi:hypothetical protein